MKIAIDYRLALNSNRGMARYCREIVKKIFELDSKNNYVLLVNYIPKDMALPANFSFAKINFANFILAEQFSIPWFVKKHKCDVLWCPYNTFPVFLSKKIKLFVTIHDLIFMHRSFGRETLRKAVGKFYRRFVLTIFSKRIDCYFTVSEYSNKEIQKRLRLNCFGGLTVNCLSESFVELANQNKRTVKENYFFTVSGDSPSKNLMFLIMIFTSWLPNETLFIAGISNNSVFRKYQTDRIVFLHDKITDEELIKNYSTCKAFLFPSLEEGFGIPIIEALCCQAKVIASNRSCLPEILNGNGLLFDPMDIKSFLNAIEEIPVYSFSYDVSDYISWQVPARIVINAIINEGTKK